jgi:hypothetical protein
MEVNGGYCGLSLVSVSELGSVYQEKPQKSFVRIFCVVAWHLVSGTKAILHEPTYLVQALLTAIRT